MIFIRADVVGSSLRAGDAVKVRGGNTGCNAARSTGCYAIFIGPTGESDNYSFFPEANLKSHRVLQFVAEHRSNREQPWR
jgi:hypothetical protein